MNVADMDLAFDGEGDNKFPHWWASKAIGLMLNCEADYIPATSRYTCRGCPTKIKGEACIRTGESGYAHYHPDCYYELITLLQTKLGQLVPKLNEEVGRQHE